MGKVDARGGGRGVERICNGAGIIIYA